MIFLVNMDGLCCESVLDIKMYEDLFCLKEGQLINFEGYEEVGEDMLFERYCGRLSERFDGNKVRIVGYQDDRMHLDEFGVRCSNNGHIVIEEHIGHTFFSYREPKIFFNMLFAWRSFMKGVKN